MWIIAPHDLPDHLLSSGVNTFTLAEATQLLERTGDAVRKGLERLTRKRLIFSPARGFYVVVPPQFRLQGTVPATHFIDAMMRALGRRYYVSLISATELHGAVKPAESEPFQVMVDRHVPDRNLGTTELWFYKSRHATYDIGVEQHDGPTGPLRLASRELGVTLANRSLYSLIRERGLLGATRYIEHLAAVMDHAALLGITCPQSTATWKLGRAGGDVARVLDDLTENHRKRIARLSSPCRVLVPPRDLADRTNAFARCGCLRCQGRLAVQVQPYIGKMVAAPLCAGLNRDEARAQANDELLASIENWPGRNFSDRPAAHANTTSRGSRFTAQCSERRRRGACRLSDDSGGRSRSRVVRRSSRCTAPLPCSVQPSRCGRPPVALPLIA